MSSFYKCKFCGREIGVITYGVYRKAVVDAEAVEVVPDPEGEEFVRVDGSKVRGREVFNESAHDYEMAYRLHRKTCSGRPG